MAEVAWQLVYGSRTLVSLDRLTYSISEVQIEAAAGDALVDAEDAEAVVGAVVGAVGAGAGR